jgi:hypothetical protein
MESLSYTNGFDMLVARELLNLIASMVGEFKQWGRDAVPEATVHAQYIAIVCMLRSVGHVVQKTDCIELADKQFLENRWPHWRRERIFSAFIEPARNDLLKEFKNRLQLRGADGVTHVTRLTDIESVHVAAYIRADREATPRVLAAFVRLDGERPDSCRSIRPPPCAGRRNPFVTKDN